MQRHMTSPPLFAAPTGPAGEIFFDDFHARLRAQAISVRDQLRPALSHVT
jgi:hypothetical protein